MFTDLDLFLDPTTGAHALPPRVKRRDGRTRLMSAEEVMSPAHAEAPVPDFPHLVRVIWFHYHEAVNPTSSAGDSKAAQTGLARPLDSVQPEHTTVSEMTLNAVPLGLSGSGRSNGLIHADWGTVWHDIPLRVTYQPTRRHLHVAVSRGLWPVPALDDLGYDPAFIARLRSALTRPGLLIFLGAVGAGKTTLIWSALIDTVTRWNKKGIVLEDISEIPAEGLYGAAGAILQVPVQGDDYAPAVRHALRLRAEYIVMNEVRSANTANELILAAGRVPIMATAQGIDIVQGITALRDLASSVDGGSWAGNALANALVAVVHIKTVKRRPDGTGWFIDVDALFTDDPSSRDAIRSIIRHGELHTLRDHIKRQADLHWALPRGSSPAPYHNTVAPTGRSAPTAPRAAQPTPSLQAPDAAANVRPSAPPSSPIGGPAQSPPPNSPVTEKPMPSTRRLIPIFNWRR